MPLKPAAEFSEREALFDGEIPCVRHRGILHRHDMAVTQHQSIALLPVRPFRVVIENMEIERLKDRRCARSLPRQAFE